MVPERPSGPPARPEVSLRLARATTSCQHEQDGQVSGRGVEDPGRVHDGDLVRSSGVEVDVVDAHRHVGHHAEARQREDSLIDPVAEQAQDPVDIAGCSCELRRRQGSLLLEGDDLVVARAQARQPSVDEALRDEDPSHRGDPTPCAGRYAAAS